MAKVETELLKGMEANRERKLRSDPAPREVTHPFISVDDHLVEPPELFEGRLPAKFADRAPKLVPSDDNADYWHFGDHRVPFGGGNVLQSWDIDDWYTGPVRFDQARGGTWNIHDRVHDMDVNGVLSSLNFPSMVFGFAGQLFSNLDDPEFGLALMQAYNRWILEEWSSPHPDRIIPCQVTWLREPEVAAEEIRKNADLGFKAVAFSENPQKLGYPSVYSSHWDPFFRACEETGTVVNLHVGSSSEVLTPSTESPLPVISALFTANALMAGVDWVYAKIPLRFPAIRVVLSESGIGWVPLLLDRLRYQADHFTALGGDTFWGETSISPADALLRNFWFTSFYDPSIFPILDTIGAENVMIESDYPHADSTWPDSQETIASQIDGLSDAAKRMVTWRNAAEVYRHEIDFESATANMKLTAAAASNLTPRS